MPISADLGTQLEAIVAELVAKGRYNSKSDVLREGVRLVQEREAHLAALDSAIARGIADADAGRVKPIGQVFDRLEANIGQWPTPRAHDRPHHGRSGTRSRTHRRLYRCPQSRPRPHVRARPAFAGVFMATT